MKFSFSENCLAWLESILSQRLGLSCVLSNNDRILILELEGLEGRIEFDQLQDYFLDPNATDLGKATYKGQSAEHYQWKETIFGKIVMQTTDFYAAISGTTASPIGAESALLIIV